MFRRMPALGLAALVLLIGSPPGLVGGSVASAAAAKKGSKAKAGKPAAKGKKGAGKGKAAKGKGAKGKGAKGKGAGKGKTPDAGAEDPGEGTVDSAEGATDDTGDGGSGDGAAPGPELPAAATTEGTEPGPAAADKEPTEQARLHFTAGRALMDLGRFNAAASEFAAGYKLVPRAAFLYNIGQALWFAGKLAPALASFSRAEKTTPPPDPELLAAIREAKAAARAESKGKKKVPRPKPPKDPVELARIHYELAGALFDLARYSSAMESFRAGYKLAARPGFLLNMAVCLYEMKEYDEAIRHAEGYISHAGALDPNAAYAGEIITRPGQPSRIGRWTAPSPPSWWRPPMVAWSPARRRGRRRRQRSPGGPGPEGAFSSRAA